MSSDPSIPQPENAATAEIKPWGRVGRPPKSAAGTYTPVREVRDHAKANPKPRGVVKSGSRGGVFAKTVDRADNRAAARALYEATPGASCVTVAQETGIPEGTIRRWKSEDGWKPASKTMPDLAGKAGQLANSFRMRMSEMGKPMSDEVAAAEAAKEVSEKHAVDIRADVLRRHRMEWSAPRKLIYEAVQKRDFELAKLAKIAGETLQIVQVGECRAFGLNHDARGADGGTVVVVEREAEPLALPDPGPLGDTAPAGTNDGGEF